MAAPPECPQGLKGGRVSVRLEGQFMAEVLLNLGLGASRLLGQLATAKKEKTETSFLLRLRSNRPVPQEE